MSLEGVRAGGFEAGLGRVVRLGRRVDWCGWVLTVAGCGGLVGLGLVLLDAGVRFGAWLRLGVGVGLVAAVGVALWVGVVRLGRRDRRMRGCVALERAVGLGQNELVSAAGLSGGGAGRGGVRAALVERVERRGERALGGVKASSGVDWGGVRRGGAWVVVAAVAWVVCAGVSPRLIVGAGARWFDPFGDHPPYSLTRIEVSVEPGVIGVGGDAVVRARLSGRIVGEAAWVVVDEATGRKEAWPMGGVGEGEFERRVVGLREPVTFYVAAGRARSRRQRIEPVAVVEGVVIDVPADGTASEPGAGASVVSGVRELMGELRGLVAECRALLGGEGGGDAAWERAAESLLRRGAALSGRLGAAMPSGERESMGGGPVADQPGWGEMAGGGGGATEGETLAERLEGLRDWGERALAGLEAGGGSGGGANGTMVGGSRGGGRSVGEPAARGRYVDTGGGGGRRVDGGRAEVRSVPPGYREAAERYLWWIARDQGGLGEEGE